MTNQEALEILATKREAAANAKQDIRKYRDESATWIDSHKTTIMASVKANAVIVGADLSTWDGANA